MEDWETIATRAKKAVEEKTVYCEWLAENLGTLDSERRKIKIRCLEYVQRYGKLPGKTPLASNPAGRLSPEIPERKELQESSNPGTKALVDTSPLFSYRVVKGLQDFGSKLGKQGKLYFTSAVIRELQKHGFIRKVIQDKDWGKSTFKDYPKIEKVLFADPDLLEEVKQDIAGLISFEFQSPQIKASNIEIIPTNLDLIRKIRRWATRKHPPKGWQYFTQEASRDVPFTDESILAAAMDEHVPLIVSTDDHFIGPLDKWKKILRMPHLKVLSSAGVKLK